MISQRSTSVLDLFTVVTFKGRKYRKTDSVPSPKGKILKSRSTSRVYNEDTDRYYFLFFYIRITNSLLSYRKDHWCRRTFTLYLWQVTRPLDTACLHTLFEVFWVDLPFLDLFLKPKTDDVPSFSNLKLKLSLLRDEFSVFCIDMRYLVLS